MMPPCLSRVSLGEHLGCQNVPVPVTCEFEAWCRPTFFSLSVYINVGAHVCKDQRTPSGMPVSHRSPPFPCAQPHQPFFFAWVLEIERSSVSGSRGKHFSDSHLARSTRLGILTEQRCVFQSVPILVWGPSKSNSLNRCPQWGPHFASEDDQVVESWGPTLFLVPSVPREISEFRLQADARCTWLPGRVFRGRLCACLGIKRLGY